MRALLLAALPGLLAVAPPAALPAAAQARPAITAAALAEHVRELADDRLAGRAPATPGGEASAAYVAAQFARAGLEPVGGADFLHPVALARVRVASAAVQAGPHVVSAGVLAPPVSDARSVGVSGPLWRASPAAPDAAPPAGAVVVLRLPDERARAGDLFAAVQEAARAAGAAGLIAVNSGAPGDPVRAALEADWAGPALLLPGHPRLPVAALGARAAARLFAPAELEGAPGPLGRDGGIILAQVAELVESPNVVGLLAGRGRLRGQYLLATAHWDHLGRCAPSAPDPICNGAVDNASGVAGLIELARALRRGPRPARSILFVATTAEEAGLLGARAFIANPPVAREALVAGLNFDSIAAGGAPGPVTVLGEGLTSLDPLIARAARAAGRVVVANPPAQAFWRRTDSWALVEAGVPALALTSIFPPPGGTNPAFAEFIAQRYHQPGDAWSPTLDLSGAAADVELARRVLLLAGNARAAPAWLPGRRPVRLPAPPRPASGVSSLPSL